MVNWPAPGGLALSIGKTSHRRRGDGGSMARAEPPRVDRPKNRFRYCRVSFGSQCPPDDPGGRGKGGAIIRGKAVPARGRIAKPH